MGKKSVICALIVSVLLACFVTALQDDWKYAGEVDGPLYPSTGYPGYLLFVIIAGILSWLAISVFLIISAKPAGVKKTNPRRVAGLLALFGPVALAIASVLVVMAGLLFFLPLLLLAYLIWGIAYSIRHDVKLAILPILIPVMLSAVVFAFLAGGGINTINTAGGPYISTSGSGFAGMALPEAGLGFSVGGAKDINNFRENIEVGYLPLATDITYEGLFYDYYFDTGKKSCSKLFCPSYSAAISKDPFSKEDEYYLSVGLNSDIKESDFSRKKLNLVVVLDISGSMSSHFDRYYYDQFGRKQEDNSTGKSKMKVASESVAALLGHLSPDDRFGMVLFDDRAYLAKPLRRVGDTDMEAIKGHILELEPMGGTYFEAGMKSGSDLFEGLKADPEYENRIIFLTDAMPNIGAIGEDELLGMAKKNAENKVYTTFIGIGVDFNTELIEYITKIRGANYYSVHSAPEFKARMDDEFEYMVTPLVFNLSLVLDAPGYKIEKVYGSPEANEATGEIMRVNTLFPSKQENGETRGGLVLLKLKKISGNGDIRLKVSYEDRSGSIGGDEAGFRFVQTAPDYYENTGIRKGILLTRYASLMKSWINDERESYAKNQSVQPAVSKGMGIVPPDDVQLGIWERQSIPLQVSPQYRELFAEFKPYFEAEMSAIGDSSLSREAEIIGKLGENQK